MSSNKPAYVVGEEVAAIKGIYLGKVSEVKQFGRVWQYRVTWYGIVGYEDEWYRGNEIVSCAAKTNRQNRQSRSRRRASHKQSVDEAAMIDLCSYSSEEVSRKRDGIHVAKKKEGEIVCSKADRSHKDKKQRIRSRSFDSLSGNMDRRFSMPSDNWAMRSPVNDDTIFFSSDEEFSIMQERNIKTVFNEKRSRGRHWNDRSHHNQRVEQKPGADKSSDDHKSCDDADKVDRFPIGAKVFLKKAAFMGTIVEEERLCYRVEWIDCRAGNANSWYPHSVLELQSQKHKRPALNPPEVGCKDELTDEYSSSEDRSNVSLSDLSAAREEARLYLSMMPCKYPEGVLDAALDSVGYPFGLQGVMDVIMKLNSSSKVDLDTSCSKVAKPGLENDSALFIPSTGCLDGLIGLAFEKAFDDGYYEGRVVKKQGDDLWRVVYEDGDSEDMEYNELMRCIRPMAPLGSKERRLVMWELFSGTKMVAQFFASRGWETMTLDMDKEREADIQKDILSMHPCEMGCVPDFIWASPPCETYSRLAGEYHRSNTDFEISPKARLHNKIFAKLVAFLRWAKERHPHAIIVVENPVGRLQYMPLLKVFEACFKVSKVVVDYCCFGRDEMKPTHLWSNAELVAHLTDDRWRCQHSCPMYRKHTSSVKGTTHTCDHGAIPLKLVEEVYDYVHSIMTLLKIKKIPTADPN